jgi:glycosyltransferase involved in cell wall biosynthesis
MEKLISIAIPTLNREGLLKFTLDHFISQIEPIKDQVELVVCNNASDDGTASLLYKIKEEHEWLIVHDCKDRVALGDSFKRTVSFSSGKYVILWGDDDIPAPGLINYLLSLVRFLPEISLFYFNRLVGYEDGNSLKALTLYEKRYDGIRKIYDDSTKFITDNFWGATFMSAIMFSREVWEKGLAFDTSSHYGFEFMGILYYGNKGGKIDYENYPLCIQRKVAKRAWGTDWPKYALLGLPNMSKDLEREGLFDDGLNIWRKKYNKFKMFCYILMSASTDKKKYKPMCPDFASYQVGYFRKALVYLIIYFMPGWVYNLSRSILFKYKD